MQLTGILIFGTILLTLLKGWPSHIVKNNHTLNTMMRDDQKVTMPL